MLRSDRVLALTALLSALVIAPGGATAQAVDGQPQVGPEASISASVLAPLALLTESDVSFATEVSSTAGASASLTWWVSRHLGVSGRATWAPAQLSLRGVPPGAAVPDDLGDADYLAGTVDAVYRFLPGGTLSVFEPFVRAGAGFRDLGLEPVARPEARSATDLAVTAAAGTYLRVWEHVSLRLELRDLVSDFDATERGEGRLQHDIVVSVGASVRP